MSRPAHLTAALGTGRRILELERQLTDLPPQDPGRAELSGEHARLTRQQQEQLVAAHRAGVDWDTITFALTVHGQHADRQPDSTQASVAEQLRALMAEHGVDVVGERGGPVRAHPKPSGWSHSRPSESP